MSIRAPALRAFATDHTNRQSVLEELTALFFCLSIEGSTEPKFCRVFMSMAPLPLRLITLNRQLVFVVFLRVLSLITVLSFS